MRRLHPLEGLTIIFLGGIILLICLFYARFPQGWKLLLQFISLLALALGIAEIRRRWGQKKIVRIICNFSPIFFAISIYEYLGGVIPHLRPDVDSFLIKIDLSIFGVHPSLWMERFLMPWLIDLSAVAYASYYFIPVVLIVVLYFWGKEEEFYPVICTLLLGYYLSYAGYIAMPSIGPRYTLQSLYSTPLHGSGIAESIGDILNSLEGNKRNCFPSGHTQITLLSLWFAFTYRRPLFWIYLPIVTAIIFSTVYLRYHYVIDIIAGAVFAAITLPLGSAIQSWWITGVLNKSGRSYISSPPRPLTPSA
jgi:membrane-associated phospholipid phosphatase